MSISNKIQTLVSEYAALPTLAAAKNPLTLVNYCAELEHNVKALDAIGRGIAEEDTAAALGIVTHQLLFNIQAMRLMLLQLASHG